MKTQDRRDLSSPRRADLFPISLTLGYVVALLVDQPWAATNAVALPLWALCTVMLGLIWLQHFNVTLKARQVVAAGAALVLAAWLAPSCKHSHDTEKASGNDDPTIITELPPDTVFYLNDHLGSPVVELDARGNVIRERSYHPYGSVRRSRGRAGDPWSYVGNEYDTGSRLAHFHARQLRPRMGGFYSPDPVAVFSPEDVLAEPSRLHPYGYGSGDPINRVDANGEVWDVVVDGFFVGFDVGVIIGQNVIQGRTDTLDANLGALAADVGCAFLPFATGGGLAVRAANKVDNVFITYAVAKRATQAQAKAQQVQAHVQGKAQQTASGAGRPIRNVHLAGKSHPKTGVPFDKSGYPDFSAYRHPDVPDVRIEPSSSRSTDFSRANAASGLQKTPTGYTWHHHQDTGLMQLVETSVHRRTGHTGGFGQ